jgi:hypothetical protein
MSTEPTPAGLPDLSAVPSEIKAKAIDRLQSLLHDVERGDIWASDLASNLARLMTPAALRALADEQTEAEETQ